MRVIVITLLLIVGQFVFGQTYVPSTGGLFTGRLIFDHDTNAAIEIENWNRIGSTFGGHYPYWGMNIEHKNSGWSSFHSSLRGSLILNWGNEIRFSSAPANTTNASLTHHMIIDTQTGKVGIGTTAPNEKLEVNGNIKGPDGESYIKGFKGIIGRSTDGILHLRAGKTTGPVFLNYYETGNVVIANGGGKVGIGTTSPRKRLDVDGDVVFSGSLETESIKVSAPPGSFPDYVFHNDYQLMPLSEVQAYIQFNGHLPNVPTAKEVEANGQDLGHIQRKLLEKIEELTLYVIELKKKNEEQDLLIEELLNKQHER